MIETREIRCLLELRADESRQSPGRLAGVLIEYEKRATDRPEMFAMNSLIWDDEGFLLNIQHDDKQPIMRITPELRGSEIVIDAPLPDTSRGRDVAIMVRNKTLRGLSVEFRAISEGIKNGLREIRKAKLYAAGLVGDGAYGNQIELRNKGVIAIPTIETLWL